MSSTTESKLSDLHEIQVDLRDREPRKVSAEVIAAIGKVCANCTGVCCRDFAVNLAIPLPTRETFQGSQSWRVDFDLMLQRSENLPEHADTVKFLRDNVDVNIRPGRLPGLVSFSCWRLGEDGKCTEYEKRPAICRRHVCLSAWTAGMPPPQGWKTDKRPEIPEEWVRFVKEQP